MGRSATETDDNLAMGRRVKEARERIGLSQRRLAAMIETSQSCISLWENGINGASVACFFQLADALQVDARWLATGRPDEGMASMVGDLAFAARNVA